VRQCQIVNFCLFPSAGKSEGLRLHLVSHLSGFNLATCYFVCSAHLASLKWLQPSYFAQLHNRLESLISTLHISRGIVSISVNRINRVADYGRCLRRSHRGRFGMFSRRQRVNSKTTAARGTVPLTSCPSDVTCQMATDGVGATGLGP
jgi:hypothetical protein